MRSPQEFAIDHIPNAINLPVLTDEERELVGKLYRQSPFDARKLGAAIISANAAKHIKEHFNAKDADYSPLLYCWRGGMRSRSLTHILSSVGWKAKLLDGGYRAFRKWVVEDLQNLLDSPEIKLHILSGLTGVGKTKMLHVLQAEGHQVLDLEGIANHKGSLLGSPHAGNQPSQKHFETCLWQLLQKFDFTKPIWTEAESNRIGNVHCPPALWKKLATGKLIELQLSVEQRSILLKEEYPHFTDHPEKLSELLNALRRLRGNALVNLWQEQIKNKDWDAFLYSILRDHYDLSYRKPEDNKSIYSDPLHHVLIESSSDKAYLDAAKILIKLKL